MEGVVEGVVGVRTRWERKRLVARRHGRCPQRPTGDRRQLHTDASAAARHPPPPPPSYSTRPRTLPGMRFKPPPALPQGCHRHRPAATRRARARRGCAGRRVAGVPGGRRRPLWWALLPRPRNKIHVPPNARKDKQKAGMAALLTTHLPTTCPSPPQGGQQRRPAPSRMQARDEHEQSHPMRLSGRRRRRMAQRAAGGEGRKGGTAFSQHLPNTPVGRGRGFGGGGAGVHTRCHGRGGPGGAGAHDGAAHG